MTEWNKAALRTTLRTRLDLTELRDAADDLGVEYEGLDKVELARRLVAHTANRQQLDALVDWLRASRPDIDPAVLAASPTQTSGATPSPRAEALQDVAPGSDEELRAIRLRVYPTLWRATAILPKWPRDARVTYDDLLQLTLTLRDWYFGEGGMFLSSKAREAYGVVQDTIGALLAQGYGGALSEAHYEAVRESLSRLRTELTNDLESRQR